MRYRTTAAIAVVSGALALTTAAIPAAQATGPAHPAAPAGSRSPATTSGRLAPAVNTTNTMDVTFSNVDIDKGAAYVAAGTTNTVPVPYTYTLTATGVDPTKDFSTSLDLYRGAVASPDNLLSGNHAGCEHASTTTGAGGATTVTETCSGTVDIHPDDLATADAGATWKGVAYAFDSATSGWAQHGTWPAPTIKRWGTLTDDANPEPVTKGDDVTVTGTLSRASWDTHKYWGYAGEPVKLQFRPATSSTYTTLKTVTTNSDGEVTASSPATVDGYWRLSFAGSTTTVPSTPTGDYVDVR
ncbi:hypothetical protein [Streptantibioticus silvisoli]|uniref:Calcium-binding protein n=1 Tax=Streptantibioticus silvisoli TaxID=2705255 RepID=A0ABT6VUL9_9ACTN|nr:hypothetical protein [Streptantibioticus silvisoli]MDI5962152.1 hypothetical protein [Streptantibioticus silvisoli]